MNNFVRIALRLALLAGSAWATMAVASTLRRRPRSVFKCPVTNPDCHGDHPQFLLEVTRPDVMPEIALSNSFVLEGRVVTVGEPLLAASLLIQGRYPSSLPFYETSLLNGDFGNVIPVNGGHFRVVITDKLFAEFVQLVPGDNHIFVSAHNGLFGATLEREVIQVFTATFIEPFRAAAQP